MMSTHTSRANPTSQTSQASQTVQTSQAGRAVQAQPWSRGRLLGILAIAVAAMLLAVGGLGYGVWQLLAGTPGESGGPGATDAGSTAGAAEAGWGTGRAPDSGDAEAARGPEHRDLVAAAPMLVVPAGAATPPQDGDPSVGGNPSVGPMAGDIDIPTAVDPGPANVLTGFAHTPEGAVAQLAQIDVTVLQAMSLPTTAEVYRAWALPGGVAVNEWQLVAAVAAFLDAAAMSQTKDPAATVTVTPAGGLIKGTDGPDWVLACVLSKVTAIYQQQAQTSFAHCERMQWAGGRWLIAPGTPPAPAPSTWPGTETATDAGWRTWHPTTDPDRSRGVDNDQP